MTIEALQQRGWMAVSLWPLLTPLFIVSIITCAVFRRSRWIAPVWTFASCSALVVFALLLYLIYRTSLGSGPDWGFVGMGTSFILLFSLLEVIPGIMLLFFFPPRPAWGGRALPVCVLSACVSSSITLAALLYLPSVRR